MGTLGLVVALLVGSPAWSQAPPKGSGEAAKALYDQAKQRETAGDLAGAYQRLSLLAQDYPDSEWGQKATTEMTALAARVQRQYAPSPVHYLLFTVVSLLSSLVGLLVVGTLFGFVGWRAGWFWQWALMARIAEAVDASLFRFRTRQKLSRELEARKTNPRDSRARYALGVLYFQQRRYESAAEELAEAVSLDPDRLDAQYHLGLAYLRLNRPQEAVPCLERVAAQKPTHGGDALVRLAEAQLAIGQPAEAERLARDAVERLPGDAESRLFLATALLAQGKREELRALLEEAVRLGRAYRGTRRREALSAARRARAQLRRLT